MTQKQIPFSRSLNPTPRQMQEIKVEHLKRRFERTGITPAQIFYKQKMGVIDWIEKEISYVDKSMYRNNVAKAF